MDVDKIGTNNKSKPLSHEEVDEEEEEEKQMGAFPGLVKPKGNDYYLFLKRRKIYWINPLVSARGKTRPDGIRKCFFGTRWYL